MRPSSDGLRVSYALLAGAITASVAWLAMPIVGSILLGWDVAVVLYLAWTFSSVAGLDPGDTVVHTVYALRYARAYYSAPVGGIAFNEDEPPNYVDFAYYSFTVGMTFQVADTNITLRSIRRTTLHHALLSYLFGSVLLGVVINVVAALLK